MSDQFVMDINNLNTLDKECSALGGLFQTVMSDMKAGYPVWEDLAAKALKLHSSMKATSIAATAFLDSFQKVADMATNTKGATRDIGTALTRLCMRQRSIEAKMRQFTTAVVENLVGPLQDRMEDWKKMAAQLDKDHAKEYKKARHEIKKLSTDTVRLQKKVKKGSTDKQKQLQCHLQNVSDKYLLLEETEKNAVRQAMIEERNRFCLFVNSVRPVVDVELEMLSEITHLEEIMEALKKHTAEPKSLPDMSEQVIRDVRGSESTTSFFQASLQEASSTGSSNASTPSSPYPPVMTWPAWPEGLERGMPERPHTISSPYEHHQAPSRPPLTSQTFEPPDKIMERSMSTPTNSLPRPERRTSSSSQNSTSSKEQQQQQPQVRLNKGASL
ncbi:PREDICTED: MTSS1-like protein [Priapulus caudatus]|uniref:MTSS1-like protein n=1 Tax=Priapulus caudatus TaxID=37621 RepID=A0ABM1EH82_PRICU|nr:PREDICTED: MTSS1-like protein [Priapulus caudatus]